MARPNHKQVRLSHGSALVFTFIISCEEMLDDIARQPHRSQCRCIDTAPARSDFSQNLFATANTPAAALQHAACVMDQYLDQDRDGVADDPNVVSALTARQATMIMGATESDVEDVFDAIDDNGGTFGDRELQDVYASETAYYDGAGYFDASLEEVLHLAHGVAVALLRADRGEAHRDDARRDVRQV